MAEAELEVPPAQHISPNLVNLVSLTDNDCRLPVFNTVPALGIVRGHLIQYVENWKSITDSAWLHEVVKRGYKFHFLQYPIFVIHLVGHTDSIWQEPS